MKKQIIKLSFLGIVLVVVMTFMSIPVSAQSERFLWETHGEDYTIYRKVMDSVGNLYVAGKFESLGRLAGQLICPADTNQWLFASTGVFVAKFDTAGTLLWCRSVKDWKDGHGGLHGLEVHNGMISFMFGYESQNLQTPENIYMTERHCWLHFIDTTYYGFIDGVAQPYGTLPYRNANGPISYLVTLDLDGNRLDTKIAEGLSGSYLQDSRGNHYFLESRGVDRSGHGGSLTLNDDTTRRFYYRTPPTDFYPQAYSHKATPFLVKINPEWTDATIVQLTDSVNGFVNSTGDSVFRISNEFETTFAAVDDDDNILLTGRANFITNTGGITASFSLELKFNNGSSLILEKAGHFYYIMCIDTLGNVNWLRQFFYDYSDGKRESAMGQHGGVAVDSAYLYYIGTFCSFLSNYNNQSSHVYFDREHQDTLFLLPNQLDATTFVVYDKYTGEYITHIPITSEGISTDVGEGNTPYVNDDYLMTNVTYAYQYNCTYRYNKHTMEADVYDTVYSPSWGFTDGISACDHGFVEKRLYSSQTSFESPNFYIPANNSSILYYYDSLLDKRRRHLPPQDTTAIAGMEQVNLEILPNPTTGTVKARASSPINLIELYDSQGRLIEQRKMSCFFITLDLTNRPKGIYFLKVHTQQGTAIRRKIVKM